MSSRTTNCPNCGGQVEFKAGTSLLSVCPYCSSAVARVGDDITELEILGQVAPLADLGSPLALGTRGALHGRDFMLVGRVQLDYGLGPWNEWYAAFDDQTWAWIAEAQGRVYVTFGQDASGLPGYAEAYVGSQIVANDHVLTVTERRRAKFVAGEGELPFAVRPDQYLYYCDVEGRDGVFGTLDYGVEKGAEPEALFLGRQLEYEDLFDKSILKDVTPGQAAASVGLNCPSCGAGVELRAPDEAQRVTCGSCDSLLDCSQGQELFLLTSSRRGGPEPRIPLGSKGSLAGRNWTVYGHLTRSVTYEGIRYLWQEYLLRDEERGGYRWLLYNDGHWSWITPVHAGDVTVGTQASYRDETYQHFQSSTAKVDYLRGEFYWKVTIGEQVGMTDYVRPPFMLSREQSVDEINWSLGEYLDKSEIEQAFKLEGALPTPRGVAPNQPNPHRQALKRMSMLGALFTALLILVAVFMSATSDNQVVLGENVTLSPPVKPGRINNGAPVKLAFNVPSGGNMAITVVSDVENSWLFVGGRMINETKSITRDFGVEVSYYHGYSGGESWSSGNRRRTVYLGGVDAGDYTLTMYPQWGGKGRQPSRFNITMTSQVFLASHAYLFGFLLWLMPLIQAIRYYAFEKRRWAESDHG